jgi:hypothetical protein
MGITKPTNKNQNFAIKKIKIKLCVTWGSVCNGKFSKLANYKATDGEKKNIEETPPCNQIKQDCVVY